MGHSGRLLLPLGTDVHPPEPTVCPDLFSDRQLQPRSRLPLNIATDGVNASDVGVKLASSTDEACADRAPLRGDDHWLPDRLPLNDAELVAIETYWADILDEVLRSSGLVFVRAWSRHIGLRV